MATLRLFNMSTCMVEGVDDSGRIYIKRQDLMAIMIVLSMLQLKGCDDVAAKEISGFNYGVLIFTTARGLLFIFLWMRLCNTERNGGEPDAEPEVLHDPHAMDQLDEASTLMPSCHHLEQLEESPMLKIIWS